MKKLYIAFCLGFLASGNFAMERESAKSQDLDKLTFAAIAEQAGVKLSRIIEPKDDNTRPHKQNDQTMFIGLKFQRYNKLKASNEMLSKCATTNSISIQPLEIKGFAECTPEQIDEFEEKIIARIIYLKQQAGVQGAKKIESLLAGSEDCREILDKANQAALAGKDWKKTSQRRNKSMISVLPRRPIVYVCLTGALIGCFMLARYMFKR